MKKKFIKVLSKEHGEKVLLYFKSKGVNTLDYSCTIIGVYYGVLNGVLSVLWQSDIEKRDYEIFELPNKEIIKYELDAINPNFNLIWNGIKTFELRYNDRNYKEGDIVLLKEYDLYNKKFTGRSIEVKITYILSDFYVLEEDYIVFSFIEISRFSK